MSAYSIPTLFVRHCPPRLQEEMVQESVQVLATTRTNVIAAHDAMNAFLVRCDILGDASFDLDADICIFLFSILSYFTRILDMCVRVLLTLNVSTTLSLGLSHESLPGRECGACRPGWHRRARHRAAALAQRRTAPRRLMNPISSPKRTQTTASIYGIGCFRFVHIYTPYLSLSRAPLRFTGIREF